MNVGKIVYEIVLQGAAIFQREGKASEKTIADLKLAADKSSASVDKTSAAVSGLSGVAAKSTAPLEGVAKWSKSMAAEAEKAGKSAKSLGEEADGAAPKAKKLGDDLTDTAAKTKAAQQEIGVAALGIGAAFAAVTVLAVVKAAEFNAQMSQVKSLSHATTSEMDQLTDAALHLGQGIGFSATQVAEGETELVKAGVSVKDQIGGALVGSLNLAAAGQISVADATSTAAVAMTQFGLKGKDVPHIADLLAAGADKALGSVGDLSQALNQGGLVSAQFGLSVDDTVGTLSAFANAGLLGSDAGTSLKQTFLQLASPSKQAAGLMQQLGINAYDAQGKFIGITGLAGQLKDKLHGLTEAQRNAALSTIFGSDAIRAANILYTEGADGIQGWIDGVNDGGFAAAQAAGKMDNLQGDVTKLGAAFDTALIQTGSGANDTLRHMVQIGTDLATFFSGLPGPIQGTALVMGIAGAAVFLLGGAFLVTIPKVVAFRAAMTELNEQMPKTVSAGKAVLGFLGGPWGAAITIATLAVGYFASKQADAAAQVEAFTGTIDAQTSKITDSTREMVKTNLTAKDSWSWLTGGFAGSAYDAAKQLGIGLDDLTDAAEGNAKSLEKVKAVTGGNMTDNMKRLGLSSADYQHAVEKVNEAVDGNNSSIKEAIKATQQKAEADAGAASVAAANTASQKAATQAYNDQASAASDLLNQLNQLIDGINTSNDVGGKAVTTNASYQQSLQDVKDTIDKAHAGADGYSTSLDENTEAGSKNAAMFQGLSSDSHDAADAQFKLDLQTMSSKDATDKYIASLTTGRQTLYDQILALTGNADAAQALTDKIYGIPSQKQIDILANTASAASTIDGLIRRYDGRTISLIAQVTGTGLPSNIATGGNIAYADGGKLNFYADGGRENHIAQYARAGTWRVWAEDETGGEYYVPMAPSKRARSVQVTSQLVDELGYTMIPKGVQSFASGGRTGSVGASSVGANFGPTYNGNVYVIDPDEFARQNQKQAQRALKLAGLNKVIAP